MRGSCRRRRRMRWTVSHRRKCLHLIRHGFAVPPSPHRGRQRGAPHPLASFSGELSPKVTERSSQICSNLSAEPPPLKGEAFRCGGVHLSGPAGQRPLTRGAPGVYPRTKKEQAFRLALSACPDQIARSTLLERRHLVQTYTWRGVPSTIALTRLTLGFHARLARL